MSLLGNHGSWSVDRVFAWLSPGPIPNSFLFVIQKNGESEADVEVLVPWVLGSELSWEKLPQRNGELSTINLILLSGELVPRTPVQCVVYNIRGGGAPLQPVSATTISHSINTPTFNPFGRRSHSLGFPAVKPHRTMASMQSQSRSKRSSFVSPRSPVFFSTGWGNTELTLFPSR